MIHRAVQLLSLLLVALVFGLCAPGSALGEGANGAALVNPELHVASACDTRGADEPGLPKSKISPVTAGFRASAELDDVRLPGVLSAPDAPAPRLIGLEVLASRAPPVL